LLDLGDVCAAGVPSGLLQQVTPSGSEEPGRVLSHLCFCSVYHWPFCMPAAVLFLSMLR